MRLLVRTRGSVLFSTFAAFVCVCLTATTACAHHAPDSEIAGPASAGISPITSKELRKFDDRDVYTAIALLRPAFLTNHGRTSILLDSPDQPEVFIDGMFYGTFDTLRQLPVHEIYQIRFLDVGDATIRYGTGHTSGIIDITSIH